MLIVYELFIEFILQTHECARTTIYLLATTIFHIFKPVLVKFYYIDKL